MNQYTLLTRGLRAVITASLVILAAACDKKEESSVSGPESGAESLSDPSIMPDVVFTLPTNGSSGPFNNVYNSGPGWNEPHFIVKFNKYINVASIKQSSISCQGFPYPVRVIVKESYYYYWWSQGSSTTRSTATEAESPFRDLIEFAVVRDGYSWWGNNIARYEIGKSYTVTIDTSIQDINGNHPVTPYSFSFSPEPRFRVLETNPESGSEISSGSVPYASIFFNAAVTDQIFSKVSISPPLSGTWRQSEWDSSTVEFRPDTTRMWGFGKTYELIVDADAADSKGNALTNEYRSRFSTKTFRVANASYHDGQAIVYLATSIGFQLTGVIEPSTIRPALTVSPALSGDADVYYWFDYFDFRPRLGFKANQTYTVTVGTSLTAADGTPLQEPFVLRLSTGPFQIRSTYPSDGDLVSPNSNLYVDTNSLLDPNTVASSVSITPAYGGGFTFYSSSFSKAGSFAANTSYTVVISTGLRSMAGDTLAAPYRFTFRTGP